MFNNHKLKNKIKKLELQLNEEKAFRRLSALESGLDIREAVLNSLSSKTVTDIENKYLRKLNELERNNHAHIIQIINTNNQKIEALIHTHNTYIKQLIDTHQKNLVEIIKTSPKTVIEVNTRK